MMPRILVRPDELQSLSAALKHTSGQLALVAARLRSSAGNMDWESVQRAAVERNVSVASDQAAALAGSADRMAGFLALRAELFQEADSRSAGEVHKVLEDLQGLMEGVAHWAAAHGIDAGDVGRYTALVLGGPGAIPGLMAGDWLRSLMPDRPAPTEGAQPPAAPPPTVESPPLPQHEPRIFQGIDLHQYFSPAQAKALYYTLTKEGGGFTTAHGSVYSELQQGQMDWDNTLLNYGIISYAFPQGGGYGLLNRLVHDPGAAAELDRIFPQHLKGEGLKEEFVTAFSSGNAAAAEWWKANAMASEHEVKPEWLAMLKAWAQTEENKRVQLELVASKYMLSAVDWAKHYGIQSERGLAFLFDVSVQNGSPPPEWEALKGEPDWAGLSDQEKLTRMLPLIPQPVSRNRKAPIVNGGADFEQQWGLSYDAPWRHETH